MIFSESEDSDLGKEQVSFCLLSARNWHARNIMKQTQNIDSSQYNAMNMDSKGNLHVITQQNKLLEQLGP